MRIGILAEKLGMSRYYDENSSNQAVTLLKVSNCRVISIQSKDKNGYDSVTLSHGKSKKPNKPFKSFLKKNKLNSFLRSKEFRVDSPESFKVGDEISVTNFVVGQYVDVSSNSIGKGFAGGMKRHNFAGNRATHGVSISHRSHGSTGQCQDPGKVFKGKKMAGRLGNKKITTHNLLILKVDKENSLLVVKGAVPGHKGCMVRVIDAIKKDQDIKVTTETSQNVEDVKNTKENLVTEQPNLASTEPKNTEVSPKNDEVKNTKENIIPEQSNESPAGAKSNNPEVDSEDGQDLKQVQTNKEEDKS
jgi:large subunit ribosomal protein L3